MAVDYAIINQTMGKMAHYLRNHNSICVSVSGGSDSDIITHIIATYFREYLPKIHFVFANTGLEFKATKDHLDYLEKKYDIHIDRVRGMSVVTAVRKYGVPVFSKEFSDKVSRLERGSEYAQSWFRGEQAKKFRPTETQKLIATAALERGIKLSSKCCDKSKKKPVFDYYKEKQADLSITGERRAEGGLRDTVHKSCFEEAKQHPWDKYMPLFFWSDETKAYYKDAEGIKYSDCYEVWGFKRTGCVGCPFNSKVAIELETIKKYEPKLYEACINVFGESYRLLDEFCGRPKKVFKEFDRQISFSDLNEDEEEENGERVKGRVGD